MSRFRSSTNPSVSRRAGAVLLVTALMLLVAASGFAQSADETANAAPQPTVKVYRGQLKHGQDKVSMPFGIGPRASSPSGAHLTYFGGKIDAAPNVVMVLWGSGSYASFVSSTATPSMATFYTQFLSKTTLTAGTSPLLAQYNTTTQSGTRSNQTFTANGAFSALWTINPSITGSTVDDSQIQTEITAQINAGHLPAPGTDAAGNPNTYYAIFFPPGITITQGGTSSCVSGGFCAYHGTIPASGSRGELYYGIHPDMQPGSGCATGCGNSTTFGNYTSVASHELVETMTDAEVGLVTGSSYAYPAAWGDNTNGEIGDICNAQQGTFAGCDGATYTYQLEFSNAAPNGNACVTVSPSCGSTANDFSISASPASVSVAQGGSGSSTITTATVSGTAQTVTLAVSGVPSGVTATVSPTSVTSGGSSTLSIVVGSSTAAGTYIITVTGTAASGSHSTTVALTVTSSGGGGSGISNGGFELGNFTGWTASGASETVVNSGCHSGSYCARLGSTTPTNGDSTITQTFTAPTGTTGISLWYKMTCPDTVTYDWATVTLKDNTAGTTATLLAKTCATNAWTNLTGSITAAHSYTLTLTSHDDNYSGDPTYTLYDDVTLTSGGGGGGANVVVNGGFETGTLSSWVATGASESVVTSGCHGGADCARLGNTTATNGDSTITQTFTAATGDTKLTFWFKETCPDTVTYDWAVVTLKDNTAGTTATLLPKTCTTNAWTQVSGSVTAGHSYTLTLTSHDDNYGSDPTYTLFDDVLTQ